MARAWRGRRCFYCGVGLAKPTSKTGRSHHSPTSYTVEHVFPQSMPEYRPSAAPDHFEAINTVPACRKCNNRKGGNHPLAWLAIMPSFGVEQLSARLVLLGVRLDDVRKAKARRQA